MDLKIRTAQLFTTLECHRLVVDEVHLLEGDMEQINDVVYREDGPELWGAKVVCGIHRSVVNKRTGYENELPDGEYDDGWDHDDYHDRFCVVCKGQRKDSQG